MKLGFLIFFLHFQAAIFVHAQDAAPPTLSTGSQAVSATSSMEVLDNSRKLGIGDRVSFRIVEDRKDPIPLVVTDSGEMEVPLIGRAQAFNKTCKELAYEIKALLEKEYYNRATVIIGLDTVSVRSAGRVYITGQVRSQGPMEIPPGETLTLSRAIIRAGGFADFANKRKVKLIRKKSPDKNEVTIVDLVKILDKGLPSADPPLQADDLVVVPARSFVW